LNMDYILGMETTPSTNADWEKIASDFAPNVYMHSNEEFMPSDAEYHLSNTTVQNNYMVTALNCAICTNHPFLYGKNPSTTTVPMYAVIHTKNSPAQTTDGIDSGDKVVDIIYWMFYPYNRGKYVDPILWDKTWYGNHVGDWEHLTVRFVNGRPYRVYLSAHGDGGTYAFGDKNLLTQMGSAGQFRTVAYSAQGSHALYPNQGGHVYKNIKVPLIGVSVIKLTDYTNQGVLWQGANGLKTLHW
jgi:hypothetical protein